jgi:cell division protease FtsH
MQVIRSLLASLKDPARLWMLFCVALVIFVAVTRFGVFAVQPAPKLPVMTERMFTMSSAQFDELIKVAPQEVREVTIYHGLNTVIVQRDDAPRGTVVHHEDVHKLLLSLKEAGVKHTLQDPAVDKSFAATTSSNFWMFALALAVIAGGILAYTLRVKARNSPAPDPAFAGGRLGLYSAANDTSSADPVAAPAVKLTLDDIAGCPEAVAKLVRISKWLKHPFWYTLCGAKIPKGVLLVGPPGTGKTLWAQVLAAVADANFFDASGSDFVEMFVGVGASRIRKLFDKAIDARKRTGKPSIIFIDELDAVGKARSGKGQGSNDEREQTLNQLLTCMQGFNPSSGILLVAATNLPGSLDKALTRPGRFDYQVLVEDPDIEGREKLFTIHSRGLQLSPEVSIRQLAVRTAGMNGSHIRLVCSEAAAYTAERLEHLTEGLTEAEMEKLPRLVTIGDFDRAIDFVQFGDELLSRMRTQPEDDAYNTSIHEAGHAGIAIVTGGDPVTKVTRAIRSKSLGMMQAHSDRDRYGHDEKQLLSRIKMALAGRIAQELILGVRDTGARNDFEQANRLARLMVGVFGMSPLGSISLTLDENGFPVVPLSPYLATRFDKAWMTIVADCEADVRRLVKEHEARIKRVADALMEEETILGERFLALWNADDAKTGSSVEGISAHQSVPDATGFSS